MVETDNRNKDEMLRFYEDRIKALEKELRSSKLDYEILKSDYIEYIEQSNEQTR